MKAEKFVSVFPINRSVDLRNFLNTSETHRLLSYKRRESVARVICSHGCDEARRLLEYTDRVMKFIRNSLRQNYDRSDTNLDFISSGGKIACVRRSGSLFIYHKFVEERLVFL